MLFGVLSVLAGGCSSSVSIGSSKGRLSWPEAQKIIEGRHAVITTSSGKDSGAVHVVSDDRIRVTMDMGVTHEIPVREIRRIVINSRSAGFWSWALMGGGLGAATGYVTTSPTALKGAGQGISAFLGLATGFAAGGIFGQFVGQRIEYVFDDAVEVPAP